MKYFLLRTPVEKASGWQTWRVYAPNEQKAIDEFYDGSRKLVDEFIEVEEHGYPEVIKEDI